MKPYLVPGLCLLSFMLADPVGAAERVILGKRFLIRDPSGSEANRVTMVLAKEKSTDVPGIVGDPIANGATLRITTTGTNPTDEFFGLNSGPG